MTDFFPCSAQDPACQRTLSRLAEVRARMQAQKSGLLDGKAVTNSASTNVRVTWAALQDLEVPK